MRYFFFTDDSCNQRQLVRQIDEAIYTDFLNMMLRKSKRCIIRLQNFLNLVGLVILIEIIYVNSQKFKFKNFYIVQYLLDKNMGGILKKINWLKDLHKVENHNQIKLNNPPENEISHVQTKRKIRQQIETLKFQINRWPNQKRQFFKTPQPQLKEENIKDRGQPKIWADQLKIQADLETNSVDIAINNNLIQQVRVNRISNQESVSNIRNICKNIPIVVEKYQKNSNQLLAVLDNKLQKKNTAVSKYFFFHIDAVQKIEKFDSIIDNIFNQFTLFENSRWNRQFIQIHSQLQMDQDMLTVSYSPNYYSEHQIWFPIIYKQHIDVKKKVRFSVRVTELECYGTGVLMGLVAQTDELEEIILREYGQTQHQYLLVNLKSQEYVDNQSLSIACSGYQGQQWIDELLVYSMVVTFGKKIQWYRGMEKFQQRLISQNMKGHLYCALYVPDQPVEVTLI